VCALGPLADELTATHHLAATSFGAGTPFGLMAERRTAIVGLGTEYFRCLSQVHAAEDLLGDRYPLRLRPETVPVELRAPDGAVYAYELAVDAQGLERRMELLERIMSPDELARWRFHGVPLFVTSAARVTEVLVDAAERGETIYSAMPIRAG
jgi:aminoglycoside N3'-acetyltransferase